MLPARSKLNDARFTSVDEALETLVTRTSRVTRIAPSQRTFRLRLRSFEFRGIHLSRTWESSAAFEIDGRPIPVVFFPISQATTIRTAKGEQVCSHRDVGSFTIAEPGRFESVQGYSEIVLRFDKELLARYLASLDIKEPLAETLSRAALRNDLPGLSQLRRTAIELLEGADTGFPEPLRSYFHRVQEEMLALHAASALARVYRPQESSVAPHPSLGRAVEFIRMRFQDDLLIKDVAEAAGVSIRLLQVLFQQYLDSTPGAYIRHLRLAHAHRLLSLRLAGSVTEAALESGFNHLGEFSAAYLKRFGEKPSQTLHHSTY